MRLRARERACDPIDRAALDLYFGPSAQNGDELDFRALGGARDASARVEAFEGAVVNVLERRRLVDLTPVSFKIATCCLAIVLGIACLLFVLFTDGVNLLWLLAGGAMCVASAIAAMTTTCHSQEAVDLIDRCAALRRWLEDFTNLDEAVPEDLVLWNKMLVLAAALGVGEEVLRRLADAVPEARRVDADGAYLHPIYWWYYPHAGIASPVREMGGVYRESVRALSGSPSSSSGGFGGGFSGGGGGGVGGGGGGTF